MCCGVCMQNNPNAFQLTEHQKLEGAQALHMEETRVKMMMAIGQIPPMNEAGMLHHLHEFAVEVGRAGVQPCSAGHAAGIGTGGSSCSQQTGLIKEVVCVCAQVQACSCVSISALAVWNTHHCRVQVTCTLGQLRMLSGYVSCLCAVMYCTVLFVSCTAVPRRGA
jgi:hypothetical protein